MESRSGTTFRNKSEKSKSKNSFVDVNSNVKKFLENDNLLFIITYILHVLIVTYSYFVDKILYKRWIG